MFGRRKRKGTSDHLRFDLRPWPVWPDPDLDRSAEALVEVERRLDGTPWWQYRRLDEEHRSRTLSQPDWFPDWHSIRPEHVAVLAEASGRPVAAAGLLSMHPSGFVREASVAVLAGTDDPRALPFLVIRCADWVPQVRTAAQNAVTDRLGQPRPEGFLQAAPLLQAMATEDVRNHEFAAGVLSRLSDSTDTPALLEGVVDDDPRVRRACARMLLERGEAPAALDAAVRHHDAVVLRIIGTAALDQADDADATLAILWQCPNASLRSLALFRYQQAGSTLASQASEDGLFDRSPSVRFLAQRYLAAQGVDVRQRYLDGLPARVVGLQGLAEIGALDDATIVEPYLDDERAHARALAVRAIGNLLGPKSRSLVLPKLDDPSSAVVRAAGKVLEGIRLEPDTLDDLWARVLASDDDTFRPAVFRVFAQQDRWSKLLLAFRAIADDDEDRRRRGGLLLSSTQATWNRGHARPTGAQLAELTALEPTVSARFPRGTARQIQDLVKHAR